MDLGPIVRAMRHNKVRIGLIVVEIALTLAIVVNCVTMIVEARTKIAQSSGFADDEIVVVTSTPFEKAFREDGYLDNSRREDMETMLGVTDVKAVSNTRFLPSVSRACAALPEIPVRSSSRLGWPNRESGLSTVSSVGV